MFLFFITEQWLKAVCVEYESILNEAAWLIRNIEVLARLKSNTCFG